MQKDDEFMDAKQVMELLNISRSSLQRLVTEGKLPPEKPKSPVLSRRGRLMFKRSDVEKLITKS